MSDPIADMNGNGGSAASAGVTNGAPRINFNGYSFGNNNTNWPQTLGQQVESIRDDFSYAANFKGRHDLKMGVNTILPMGAINRVCPSGVARATDSVAMIPPAPVLFSTTTG